MTPRILLAAIFGAIAMFIWMFVAHTFLPLGEAGISELPNESAVVAAMQSNLKNDGMYLFPGTGLPPDASRAEKQAAMQKMEARYETQPSGLLIYHSPRGFNFPKHLAVEFVTELIEALLAVFLLAQTRIGSFGGRVAFVTGLGVLAAIGTNVPYWNWYRYPSTYTAAYMFTQLVGFICLGIVVALVLKKRQFA
ncbi:MAG: hypothetical protein ACJ8LI_00995 [Chthoniobacterales bacterium]